MNLGVSEKSNKIRRIRLVRLDVAQEGCPLADSSREYNVYIEVTSAALRGDYSILITWASGTDLKKLLRTLRSDNVIKRMHVLHKDNGSAWLYLVKESSGILKTIYEAEGILASSIIIERGVKKFTVMVPSINMDKLKSAVHRNLTAKGFKVRLIDITRTLEDRVPLVKGIHAPFTMVKAELASLLTPIERKILVDVVSRGYYSWPRKSKLEEIAYKYGLSKSTVSYHVRSAERKILELLIRKYKVLEEWW